MSQRQRHPGEPETDGDSMIGLVDVVPGLD